MATFFPSDAGDDARTRWSVVDALRRYGADAGKVGDVFAAQHRLRPHDLQALVAIMSAEGRGEPLTPTRLRGHLGLSSAGTSYVIDRLVDAGHVRREREGSADHRIVHLRYTEHGQTTARAFFGPLGAQIEQVLDEFSAEELKIVSRFVESVAISMREHLESLESPSSAPRT